MFAAWALRGQPARLEALARSARESADFVAYPAQHDPVLKDLYRLDHDLWVEVGQTAFFARNKGWTPLDRVGTSLDLHLAQKALGKALKTGGGGESGIGVAVSDAARGEAATSLRRAADTMDELAMSVRRDVRAHPFSMRYKVEEGTF